MSSFVKQAIELAKKIAAVAVPGSEPLINVVEDAVAMLTKAKEDPEIDLDSQTQAEIDAVIDELRASVNQKADATVDRLRGDDASGD